MSELTIALLRIGFVIALWIFVLAVVAVLRTDLFGTRVTTRGNSNEFRSGRGRRGREKNRGKQGARSETNAFAQPVPTNVPDSAREGGVSREPERANSANVTSRTLVVTEGPLRGTTLNLGSAPVLIGRAPECTLVLDDDYASNRHARVFLRDHEWYVEDLGSTNGTRLNGKYLSDVTSYPPGAAIKIGKTVIELRRGPR